MERQRKRRQGCTPNLEEPRIHCSLSHNSCRRYIGIESVSGASLSRYVCTVVGKDGKIMKGEGEIYMPRVIVVGGGCSPGLPRAGGAIAARSTRWNTQLAGRLDCELRGTRQSVSGAGVLQKNICGNGSDLLCCV
jgi:hypothetical protein